MDTIAPRAVELSRVTVSPVPSESSTVLRRATSRNSNTPFAVCPAFDEDDELEAAMDGSNRDEVFLPFLEAAPYSKSHLKEGTPLLSALDMAALVAFNFGYSAFWFLVSIVIQPDHIRQIVGDESKGSALAQVAGLAGCFNLFTAIYFGALNDSMVGWPGMGRRRPWIAAGTVLMGGTLWFLSGKLTLWEYSIGYIILTLGNILPSVAWYGLVADVTPPRQKMLVSSLVGAVGLLGNLCGALIGSLSSELGEDGVKLTVMTILALGTALTVASVKEPERKGDGKAAWEAMTPRGVWRVVVEAVEPLKRNKAFRMVFLARFLFQMGINTVTQFFQYALNDCITLPVNLPPPTAVSLALLPLLIVSPLASSILSLPSLRTERTKVVYSAGAVIVIVAACMGFVEQYWEAVALAGVFGAGYGPFLAVEFAMVLDVLGEGNSGVTADGVEVNGYASPAVGDEDVLLDDAQRQSPDFDDRPNGTSNVHHPTSAIKPSSHARDLSLWHSAMVLPAIFATPAAGELRDVFQRVGTDVGVHCLGYKVVWLTVVVYCLGGVLATGWIPGMK